MLLPKAMLEHWMREFYFDSPMDLGSSGVATYTFGELRKLLDISQEELDAVSFDDSLTRGSVGLRQAIANRWGDGDIEKVMTSNGSNETLYHIMSTMLEPNDEVILLDPIYHALSTVAETKGCAIKYWKLDPEQDFKPDMDDLRKLISPNTKLVAVNFPHNPTGVSIKREQQKELLDIVREVNAYLVWDAAFEEMVDGEPLPNPYFEYERAISVGTLSKGYGLPGLRIGWCFAPPEVIDLSIQLRDYTTLYISPLTELVGQKAIERADLLLKIKMDDAKSNSHLLDEWLARQADFVVASPYDGGVTRLLRFANVEDTEQFCRDLAKDTGVMVVPGECFGLKGYVRFGFGASPEHFSKGLALMSDYLEKHCW